MDRNALLQQIKARLQPAFGDRLCGVVLYGSEARGEARADSDIDVLLLLKGPVFVGRDLDTATRAMSSCTESLVSLPNPSQRLQCRDLRRSPLHIGQ